jgi:hypothetical protein
VFLTGIFLNKSSSGPACSRQVSSERDLDDSDFFCFRNPFSNPYPQKKVRINDPDFGLWILV